ncbi:MAG: DMT family transporter [Oscillospiraceae bacterium]|nr:DMT family transporter [Oscillospiraceae bacterium]MBQ9686011.1 DMT family transporter [Oscillospiraceae bacterium]
MSKSGNQLHIFFLFMAALLWGTTFVAQRMGAEYVAPFTYLAARSWVAVAFLTPLVHIMDRFFEKRGIDNRRPRSAADRRLLLLAGCLSGVMLCAASATQQIGIAYTTASKAGFITALYVVLVPLLSIFLRKRPSPQVWFCVVLALVGLYLLCMKDSFTLEYGDAWELVCAFLFAVEILILSHFSSLVDAVRLSRMQFLVGAVISTVIMLLTEHPTMESFRLGLPAILYAGIVSSGIAYTLQIFGQDGVNATVASLVMSLESVFSALSGWLVLHERMSVREFSGAGLMFLAIILSQLEWKPKKKTQF